MLTNLPIIDTHCDVVIPYQDLKKEFKSSLDSQTSLPLLKKAKVKIIFAGFSYDDLLKDSDNQFSNIHQMINEYSEDFELILDFNQVDNILKGNKIGVIIHIEGAAILDNKIANLLSLYKKGLRSLGFTHNTKNCLGTGALVDDGQGLTDFGKEVIKKCNELNIILDLAHLNEAGFYDVIKLSNKIPIISHGNSFKITPNPRNYKDDQLKEIAKIGSVIGVFFSGKFTNPEMDGSKATIADALNHIEHIVDLIGIDHICIGSDFGGITTGLPQGLENHSKLNDLFKKLKDKGYTKEDLEKIAYKNMLRILNIYKV